MKDLITDILQYLKENEEARERFNKLFDKVECERTCFVYNDELKFNISMTDKSGQYGKFNNFSSSLKSIILIHALSSPNGKHICGFLGEKNKNREDWVKHISDELYSHYVGSDNCNYRAEEIAENCIIGKTISQYIRNLYLDQLDNGKSHEEAYKIINEEYNKLNLK